MKHRQHNRILALLAALLACVLALPAFGSIPRFADSANYSGGKPAAGIVSAPQSQGAPRALTLSLSLDRMSYDNGNVTLISGPGTITVSQEFDARNALIKRTTVNPGTGQRVEHFEYDGNLNLTKQIIDGARTTSYEYDQDNRLTTISMPSGITRSFTYNKNNQVLTDTIGGVTTTYTYDAAGRLTGSSVSNGAAFTFELDNEGRRNKVKKGAADIYAYTRAPDTKFLTKIEDSSDPLGGTMTLEFLTDNAGYGHKRTLKQGADTLFELTQPINDVNALKESTIKVGSDTAKTLSLTLDNHVRPDVVTRPGNLPATDWDYNGSNEVVAVDHGSAGSVDIVRDPATGFVTSRADSALGITDSYTANAEGWLLSETRDDGSYAVEYEYRDDGARSSQTINDQVTEFITNDAGGVVEVRNAILGGRLYPPLGEEYTVGTDGAYPTVEAALQAVFLAHGGDPFTAPIAISLLEDSSAPILVRGTGSFSDDFNDGTAAAWDTMTQTGGGTLDPAQALIRRGTTGYAPHFSAGTGAQAFLSRDLGGVPHLVESVWLYIDTPGPATAAQSVLLQVMDGNAQAAVEVRLLNDSGLLKLHTLFSTGSGLQSAGELPVAGNGWVQLALTYKTSSGVNAGSFRWWLDNTPGGTVPAPNTGGLVFNNLNLGLISVTGGSCSLITDDLGLGGLQPTAAAPLIIRSGRGCAAELRHELIVRDQANVRVQSLTVTPTGSVLFAAVPGAQLASCVVTGTVTFDNCLEPLAVGNTFDSRTTGPRLSFINATGALSRNNIFWNNGITPGWTATGAALDSDWNCYYPAAGPDGEGNSLNADPKLHPEHYFFTTHAGPAQGAGTPRLVPGTCTAASTIVIAGSPTPAADTPGSSGNLAFHDANGNGLWDPGEDIWASAVAEKISAITTEDYISARAKKSRNGAFRKVLDKVPKREPLPGDEF